MLYKQRDYQIYPPYQRNVMNRNDKKGFSLVEALISIVLLAMVIAGSYSLIIQSSSAIRSARNHYLAVNIGKDRVERARNFDYKQLYLLAESLVIVDENGNPANGGSYRRTTTINTNYQPSLTMVSVQTDIRNRKSNTFKGDSETVSGLFTEYLTQ